MDKRLSNSNEYKEYTENEKNMRRIDKIISSLKIKIKP